MTDEELIARLRKYEDDLLFITADRIEALVKDKERLGREVNMARYGQPDFAWSIHKQAMADIEAKLAKAADVIEWALICWDDHNKHGYTMQGDWVSDARATLAALTGAKP